ncbi:GGDEF domain-containing protein [Nocardia jejuensis]|uniref:GGDEF domain-containing protein n=1 Tax=Nocardia jejuensis TaxID=328049 RepID=UPI0014719B15|nr:GGDEF domain-containing protein [Nocardia jejuensis]
MWVDLRLLREWWREDVDYQWVVDAIASRSALGILKVAIGWSGLAAPMIGVLTVLSPAGPSTHLGRTVLWILIAGGIAWAAHWLVLPWPGKRASLALVAAADGCVTVMCAVSTGYAIRSVGTILLLIVGVYVSAFHSPKVLAAHTVWSMGSVGVFAAPLFGSGDTTSAVVMMLGMAAAVVVPPGLQFCYWVLRSEMLSDPLTMLLSRRGLDYHAAPMLARRTPVPLGVLMIDLDRFKVVNDTFGHCAGDDVLVRTADRLRRAAPAGSIVSRFGGEEFAIIVRLPADSALAAADRLRCAVAEPIGSISVTASIGLALVNRDVAGERNRCSLREVIRSADQAMYQAKQQGGDAVVVAGTLSPADPERLAHHRPGRFLKLSRFPG